MTAPPLQGTPRRALRRSLAALACAALLAGCEGDAETVTIGIAGPISKANGRSMKLAAEMAAEEINARNLLGGNRKLVLEIKDDEGDPAKAISVATELRQNEEVSAVVGHVNSAATLRAATIYNAPPGEHASNPVVALSPASSAPEITQAGDWTFRVTPTDLEFSPALAEWASTRLGRQRAAVLYTNDAYGQGVMSTFVDAFRKRGGAVVTADPFLPATFTSAESLDPYLLRAFRQNVDALVIAGQAEAGVKIIAAARRLGFTGPILGSDGLTGVKDAGAIAEGVFVSSAFLADRPNELAQRFVQAYQAKHKELPDHRGAMTYDALLLLAQAIREKGTDRETIRDYLAAINDENEAYDGVSGRIRFDPNGDVLGKDVAVGIVRAGRLVTAR